MIKKKEEEEKEKLLKNLCRVGNSLNPIKTMHRKPTENLILNGEKPAAFLLRLRTRQRGVLSPCPFSTAATQSTGHKKGNTSMQVGKIKTKITWFTDDKVAYKNNPK